MDFLPACVLCGAKKDAFERAGEKDGYHLERCSACGLMFINPRDDRETIFKQYETDHSSPIGYYLKTAPFDSQIFNRRLDWIEKVTPRGRLLDIGCNVGTFMTVARDRGWDVSGIDVNKKAVEHCRSQGFKVYQGIFSQPLLDTIEKKEFDLVSIHDVIEHFPNPLDSIRLIAPLLKKGGILAVNTPNIESWMARIFQIKPHEHIFYFNQATLKRLITQAGFEVLDVVPAGRKRDFSSLMTGVTLKNKAWLFVCGLIHRTGLSHLANFMLDHFFKDEIFVIARKG